MSHSIDDDDDDTSNNNNNNTNDSIFSTMIPESIEDKVLGSNNNHIDDYSLIKKPIEKEVINSDDEKPFKCESCTKAFRRSEHLKRHIRSVHSNIRPFPCKFCDKKFSRSDNLAQHLRTHNKWGARILVIDPLDGSYLFITIVIDLFMF